MIITVTMNPALDKTARLSRICPGGLNRLQAPAVDAGGKGINVSKTLKSLGGVSVAVGLIGGSAGQRLENHLRQEGIQTDFLTISGETRTNLKIVEENGSVTEFNEPGPCPSLQDIRTLLDKLASRADPQALFVLAGSLPQGVPTDIYREIICLVHRRGARVLLDADGEAFCLGMEAGPDIIKPNLGELASYLGLSEAYLTDEPGFPDRLAAMGTSLLDKGAGFAAVSLGKMGALFLCGEQRVYCPGLSVEPRSTVGAGDAMAAALAYGWEQGFALADTIRLAMAVSAGAVTTPGTRPPSRKMIDTLMEQVTLRYL